MVELKLMMREMWCSGALTSFPSIFRLLTGCWVLALHAFYLMPTFFSFLWPTSFPSMRPQNLSADIAFSTLAGADTPTARCWLDNFWVYFGETLLTNMQYLSFDSSISFYAKGTNFRVKKRKRVSESISMQMQNHLLIDRLISLLIWVILNSY